ncbi:hypothetical protein [Streptomyces marianii]|uniref:Integral membrane protein n=1 Tax=Streptomyces marianii TaxID=1817406 RepID=A0A5R9E8E3_9ACTN|nr:hypothetical protein [Streptomyces marianii]TLQ45062.1 hypothetical protein FEF34_20215 [Streptomyces marianii]
MEVNTGHMRKWSLIAVGVNLLMGIPGVIPVWLLWYFAANWPLAEIGWTQRSPTENDGMLPWMLIAVPVLGLFALLWWLANQAMRRRTTLNPRLYWPISLLVPLVPSFTLVIVL